MMLGVGGVSYYDAELWAWGLNDFGQAGNNTSGPGLYSYSSPVQIPGTNWDVPIQAGYRVSGASKTDGGLLACFLSCFSRVADSRLALSTILGSFPGINFSYLFSILL